MTISESVLGRSWWRVSAVVTVVVVLSLARGTTEDLLASSFECIGGLSGVAFRLGVPCDIRVAAQEDLKVGAAWHREDFGAGALDEALIRLRPFARDEDRGVVAVELEFGDEAVGGGLRAGDDVGAVLLRFRDDAGDGTGDDAGPLGGLDRVTGQDAVDGGEDRLGRFGVAEVGEFLEAVDEFDEGFSGTTGDGAELLAGVAFGFLARLGRFGGLAGDLVEDLLDEPGGRAIAEGHAVDHDARADVVEGALGDLADTGLDRGFADGGEVDSGLLQEVVNGEGGEDTDGTAFDGASDEIACLFGVDATDVVADAGLVDAVHDGPLGMNDRAVSGEQRAVAAGLE